MVASWLPPATGMFPLGSGEGPPQKHDVIVLAVIDRRGTFAVGTSEVGLGEALVVAGLHVAVRIHVNPVITIVGFQNQGRITHSPGLCASTSHAPSPLCGCGRGKWLSC